MKSSLLLSVEPTEPEICDVEIRTSRDVRENTTSGTRYSPDTLSPVQVKSCRVDLCELRLSVKHAPELGLVVY